MPIKHPLILEIQHVHLAGFTHSVHTTSFLKGIIIISPLISLPPNPRLIPPRKGTASTVKIATTLLLSFPNL